MNKFKNILKSFYDTAVLITNHYKNINQHTVNSNEEYIEKLLTKPKDKLAFERTIDELMKENNGSKRVTLNNKKVTISI